MTLELGEGQNAAPISNSKPLPVSVVAGGGTGGPATIADGADVVEGALADGAVAAGAAGSVSAKLRRLTTDLNTLLGYLATGGVAHDAVDSGNSLEVGGYASASAPSDVSADADRVRAWFRRNGAQAIYMAYGLNITDDAVLSVDPAVSIRPTITGSTTPAYSAGDCLNTIITLSGVMYASGRSARLVSVSLNENGGLTPDLTLLFFRATPASGTYTDNAALVWGSGDAANRVGILRVKAADWYTVGSKSFVTYGDLSQIMGAASADLFLVIVVDAAYTMAATGNLTAEFGFQRM